MRISDWSSDVCSSDLLEVDRLEAVVHIAVDHARRTGNAFPRPQARGNALPLIVLQKPRKKPLKNEENFFDFLGLSGITQIGRASCRESVCQDVYISVVDVSLKQKHLHILKHQI